MDTPQVGRPIEVLLVEDNPGDVRWTKEILKEVSVPTELCATRDGLEALQFLQDTPGEGRAYPDLMLLDLHLPRKDGLELLADLKKEPRLREIPVAILATSENDRDVEKSFQLGAISYLAKPVEADCLSLVVNMIADDLASGKPLP